MHPSEQPGERPVAGPIERAPVDRGPIVCAIPARLASIRLPGKVLRPLAGRPLIEHVVERALGATTVDRVVVLTEDARVRDAVLAFGGECEMTPAGCPTGTDRVAWAARGWDAAAVINVQGDEPLLDPAHVDLLARLLRASPEVEMATLAAPADPGDLADPAKVKVVCDRAGRALYFSRAAIPHARDGGVPPALRHVGIYAYRRDVLLRLADLDRTPLERCEALEQLRALEHGIGIRVLEVEHHGFGVDTEADLARAEALLAGTAPVAHPVQSD
ncbi:MAG TPA: 3-deoxy-manno-octulosonate cytidylyltransferase [Thermoanaerobaculia bacterium]|nr:3-deoxy-manno-octulosonate cytidylyltransferase [Thermoanaerobaculia bacterium]